MKLQICNHPPVWLLAVLQGAASRMQRNRRGVVLTKFPSFDPTTVFGPPEQQRFI